MELGHLEVGYVLKECGAADVTLPGDTAAKRHSPGSYTIVKSIPTAPDGKAQGKARVY